MTNSAMTNSAWQIQQCAQVLWPQGVAATNLKWIILSVTLKASLLIEQQNISTCSKCATDICESLNMSLYWLHRHPPPNLSRMCLCKPQECTFNTFWHFFVLIGADFVNGDVPLLWADTACCLTWFSSIKEANRAINPHINILQVQPRLQTHFSSGHKHWSYYSISRPKTSAPADPITKDS